MRQGGPRGANTAAGARQRGRGYGRAARAAQAARPRAARRRAGAPFAEAAAREAAAQRDAGHRRADSRRRARRGRHARRPLPRRPLPAARLHAYPAHRAQGRIARRRQARQAERAPRGRQKVRVPPLKLDAPRPAARTAAKADEDDARLPARRSPSTRTSDVLVLNKPMGLAVQGGSGTKRHVDGMLDALRDARGPEAAPRAPARQGHRRLPRRRQDALRRGGAGEILPLAAGAQDLLGARRRRAAGEAGPRLDLPRQGGGGRAATRACASPATATRAPATR